MSTSPMLLRALLVLLVPAVVARAAAQSPAPDDPRAVADSRAATGGIEVVVRGDANARELAEIAARTRSRLAARLALDPAAARRPFRLYVSSDLAWLHSIERAEGVTPSTGDGESFHGCCYPERDFALVQIDELDAARWQVAHETVHAVFHALVGCNVPILNEGLAEVAPWWALAAWRGEGACRYPLYERRLARAVVERDVPDLERWCAIAPRDFYAPSSDWANYALSWELVKVLVEDPDPRIAGRFPDLLHRASRAPLWAAMCETYDVRLVESRWRAGIEAHAEWKPAFGDWRADGDALVGSAEPGTSSCIVSSRALAAGEPIELTSSVPAAISAAAFGFVVDWNGPDDFVYVEVRPGARRIVVARRSAGAWAAFAVYALPEIELRELDRDETTIALVVEPDGSAQCVIGRETLGFDLGAPLGGGAAGWMIESLDTPDGGARASQLEFRRARLAR